MTDSVMVLGTRYSIEVKKYDEDAHFKKLQCDGYNSELAKKIVICDTHSIPHYDHYSEDDHATHMRGCLRHEIVHAFFSESGLSVCANDIACWARNEELVDWIAIQGSKIYRAWKESGALDPDANEEQSETTKLYANDQLYATIPIPHDDNH